MDRQPPAPRSERGQGQGRDQGRVIESKFSAEMTNSGRQSREKPPKPVKPKSLWSNSRSLDHASENHVNSVKYGSSSRSNGFFRSLECDDNSLSSFSSSSRPTNAIERVERTCGQNSLQSDLKQQSPWTTTSRQSVIRSTWIARLNSSIGAEHSTRQSHLSLGDTQLAEWTKAATEPVPRSTEAADSFRQCDDTAKTTRGQDSPNDNDEQPTSETAVSTECTSPSLPASFRSEHSDTRAELTCGQISPRSNTDEQTRWTETSTAVRESFSGAEEDIEPPIIYDLLPANVHMRRGDTLCLVAQFTAFPSPDISWYRANELITPGLIIT